MKSVQTQSFFWSVFSCIQTEYGDLRNKSPYSVQIQEKTDQKKLHIWTLFTQWQASKNVADTIFKELYLKEIGKPSLKIITIINSIITITSIIIMIIIISSIINSIFYHYYLILILRITFIIIFITTINHYWCHYCFHQSCPFLVVVGLNTFAFESDLKCFYDLMTFLFFEGTTIIKQFYLFCVIPALYSL